MRLRPCEVFADALQSYICPSIVFTCSATMASKQLPYAVEKSPKVYDEYKFTLSELYREVAKEELREDDAVRDKALSEMRDWIAENPYIFKCRTDAKFLLRFLRYRQFSVPMACEALERYLTIRELYPSWFKKLDCTDPTMKEILDYEPFTYLGQDGLGRAVFLIRYGQFNGEKHSALQEARYMALVLETVLEWEEFQIGGCQVIVDYRDATANNFEKWSLSELKIIMDVYSRSYPLRYGEIHAAKLPKFAVPVIETILSFANPKLREKIRCYSSIPELEKHFEDSWKPTTYGGTVDFGKLNSEFRKRIEDQRQVVLGLDDMEIDVEHYTSLWDSDQGMLAEQALTGAMLAHQVGCCINLLKMAPLLTSYSADKCPKVYDEYKFTLSELYREVAKEELREDDEVRDKALSEMREWIAENPYIFKCRTDAKFLLRFLRHRQFSVPMACEALERYLTIREMYPSWFKKLDCTDPTMKDIFHNGPFILLGWDSTGRMVGFSRFCKFDGENHSPSQDGRFMAMVMETMLESEEFQIGGCRILIEFQDSTVSNFEKWSTSDLKIMMEAYSHAYPVRYGDIHSAALPKYGAPVIDTFLSFANPKMREKISCYSTVGEMEKYFETPLKPALYGGSLDLEVANRSLWKRLEDYREVVLGLDLMEIDMDYYSSRWNFEGATPDEIAAGAMFKRLRMCYQSSYHNMATVQKVDKCPDKYQPYQPVSSALHRQMAQDELREEQANAEQALQQMREWIAKNPAIQACRTDANFLLRFLRVRKFSHMAACETLERYLVSRQRFPAWYSKLDTAEPWVNVMIDSEFVVSLGRDNLGRIVYLVRYANLDIDRFDVTEQIRFFTMVFESIFADELNQIAGIVCLFDDTNVPMRAFAQWSLTEIKNFIDCVTKAFPIRVKEVHVVNLPLFGVTVGEWIMSCCSEKLRSRLKCYRSMEEFVTKTNLLSLLPKEYGGKQEAADLKRQLKETLDHYRNVILALDDMKVDEKQSASLKNHNNSLDAGVIGSFRKLDVD
uniref:CRAL-TRIO domain-containing protein n=1 Tax=Anopheles minimus TaxID=112268 RepID=A0A182WAP0_9DIPT